MTLPLLAVDGGNAKTDIALFTAAGEVLAARRAPTVSQQQIGLEAAGRRLRGLVEEAVRSAGLATEAPLASLGVLCLAGMDLPADARALGAVHRASGIAADVVLENDTLAGLRVGGPDGWGVGVVLGSGLNAVGVAPDGRRARFAALGPITGDHGGGEGLGMDALGAAVRAQDRRGPRTSLERLVPAHFGLRRPLDVATAIYQGRIEERAVGDLAPLVLEAARAGDAVAREILEALAEETASFVVSAIRRLSMARLAVPVVLSGGVARGAGSLLADAVAERVRSVAPLATITVVHAPPVVGAALLALDRVAPGDTAAQARLRAQLTHDRLTALPPPARPLD